MLQSYPNGFNSFMVVGRRGIGKTAYSLLALHSALVELGMSNIKAWDVALKSLKFSIPSVISYLKDAVDRDEKKICLIWDDARIFAGGSQYHLNMKLVSKLSGMLDSVRTAVCTLILTCPSSSGLLGILKSYDDFLIKVHYSHDGGFRRVSKGYLWSSLPSGSKRIYHKFDDNFSCRLPDWIYKRYMVERKNALRDVLVDLEAEVKE